MRDFRMIGLRAEANYKDEWLTPPHLVSALGPFDLDPCAATDRPWDTAARHYTKLDDGLSRDWSDAGSCWLNPPYSNWPVWAERLIGHGDGIALLLARTDTRAFRRCVWSSATALMFLHGRLSFYYPNGTESRKDAGAPSVLVAYGAACAERLRASGLDGQIVTLGPSGVVALRRQSRLPFVGRAQRRVRVS